MTTTFQGSVGQTVELDLQILDANDQPAALKTDPTYVAQPAGLLSGFTPLPSPRVGVSAKLQAPGTVTVTAAGTNALDTVITTDSVGTLLPLAQKMILVPKVI